MFGVLLGRFLDEAPNWVFWLTAVLLFGLALYLLTT